MKIRIQLFGALREADADGYIDLDVPDASNIASVRERLVQHLGEHAPHVSASVVQRSAFANCSEILRDQDVVPSDGQLAILPPVSGG